MNVEKALERLKAQGSRVNREIYRRHGVREPLFGVGYAAQRRLAKRIGVDHDLALALWATGNHDARVLATMVADPDAVTGPMLDAWQTALDNHVLTDALVTLLDRSAVAAGSIDRWTRSANPWLARAAWALIARQAMRDPTVDEARFAAHLAAIEAGFSSAACRTRDAMHGAIIAIGMRNGRLRRRAIEALRVVTATESDRRNDASKSG